MLMPKCKKESNMRGKYRWAALLALMTLLLGFALCIEEEDEKLPPGPLTWEELARIIDRQLGAISDGTTATCGGTVTDVGKHCKDQLKGKTSRSMVVQLVEAVNDGFLFSNDPVNGGTMFWDRAAFVFDDACNRDADQNDFLDYSEVCASGALQCSELGLGSYRLTYQGCIWGNTADRWKLNGEVTISAYVTDLSERVLIRSFNDLHATSLSVGDSADYLVDGAVATYTQLDPFSGLPLQGTVPGSTAADGMDIVIIQATIDIDGEGNPSPRTTYQLYFAVDNEDGMVFLNGTSAVWLEDPTATPLRFYDSDFPYDLVTDGCTVRVTDVDDGTTSGSRNFDMTSPCLGDANTVTY